MRQTTEESVRDYIIRTRAESYKAQTCLLVNIKVNTTEVFINNGNKIFQFKTQFEGIHSSKVSLSIRPGPSRKQLVGVH